MKDWCTWFPESWFSIKKKLKVYIGHCCKTHDETLSTSRFYNCLRVATIDLVSSSVISLGGFLGAWVKYPKIMWDRLTK